MFVSDVRLPANKDIIFLFSLIIFDKFVLTFSAGEGKIVDISDQIHLGAMAFIRKEYSILFIFALILIPVEISTHTSHTHPPNNT